VTFFSMKPRISVSWSWSPASLSTILLMGYPYISYIIYGLRRGVWAGRGNKQLNTYISVYQLVIESLL
jgi:hypothetical protein